MSWGALMGLGQGLGEYSEVLGEHKKMAWEQQMADIRYQREQTLEQLRLQNQRDLQSSNQGFQERMFTKGEASQGRRDIANRLHAEDQSALARATQESEGQKNRDTQLAVVKQSGANQIAVKREELSMQQAENDARAAEVLKLAGVNAYEELDEQWKRLYATAKTGMDLRKVDAPATGEQLNAANKFVEMQTEAALAADQDVTPEMQKTWLKEYLEEHVPGASGKKSGSGTQVKVTPEQIIETIVKLPNRVAIEKKLDELKSQVPIETYNKIAEKVNEAKGWNTQPFVPSNKAKETYNIPPANYAKLMQEFKKEHPYVKPSQENFQRWFDKKYGNR